MSPDVAVPPALHPVVEPAVVRRAPDAPPEPPRCANCGAAAAERFCPRCGQDQHDFHRSLRSISGEALDAFAGWDAKIPASIWLLLARPGRLTTEFLSGRRVRYLRPLRLYLLLSVAFFVTLRYEAARRKTRVVNVAETPAAATTPAARPVTGPGTGSALEQVAEGFREGLRARERGGSAIDSTQLGAFLAHRSGERPRGVSGWFKYTLKDRMREIARLPVEQRDRMVRDAFLSKLGNVAICLVPVFALLLRGLYSRARLYYAEHFVVALHTHAFAFGALTLMFLLAEASRAARGLAEGALRSGLRGAIALALLGLAVWLPVYPFLTLRRVYGGSRTMTLVRYAVLGALYSMVLLAGMLVAIFAAILFG